MVCIGIGEAMLGWWWLVVGMYLGRLRGDPLPKASEGREGDTERELHFGIC